MELLIGLALQTVEGVDSRCIYEVVHEVDGNFASLHYCTNRYPDI